LSLAFVVGGCYESRPAPGLHEATRTCDSWGCGNNSASLGSVPFHELHAKGEINDQKLWVDGFFDAGDNPLDLNVKRDHLQGVRRSDGSILEDEALRRAYIVVVDAAGTKWTLLITNVDFTDSWIEADSAPIPVYQFRYYEFGNPPANSEPPLLCGPSDEPLSHDYKGTAIIFRGDRYDAAKKTVTEVGLDTQWFNIGCEKTAVAKMHLLQHTLAAGDGHVTTVDQRQAVLKMITADYCGDGTSYTINGHVLHYDWLQTQTFHPPDQHTPQLVPLPSDRLEAYWSKDQAVCLSRPRLEDEVPGVRKKVDAACGLPYCDDNWPNGAYVKSTNPALTDMGM
jgi:hypothetical protein